MYVKDGENARIVIVVGMRKAIKLHVIQDLQRCISFPFVVSCHLSKTALHIL